MKLYLIRHGATKGNREHKYVGKTDEELLPEAREELKEKVRLWQQERREQENEEQGVSFLQAERLYVSPLKRCRETAFVLYPGREQHVVENLRECDFGEFEYKSYQELNGNPDFQKFIDSGGECGFPGGETLRSFQDRCVEAFEGLIEQELGRQAGSCALVVHGGTIMAILDRYSLPHRDYYDWQVKNAEGFQMSVIKSKDGFYLGDIEKLWQQRSLQRE